MVYTVQLMHLRSNNKTNILKNGGTQLKNGTYDKTVLSDLAITN